MSRRGPESARGEAQRPCTRGEAAEALRSPGRPLRPRGPRPGTRGHPQRPTSPGSARRGGGRGASELAGLPERPALETPVTSQPVTRTGAAAVTLSALDLQGPPAALGWRPHFLQPLGRCHSPSKPLPPPRRAWGERLDLARLPPVPALRWDAPSPGQSRVSGGRTSGTHTGPRLPASGASPPLLNSTMQATRSVRRAGIYAALGLLGHTRHLEGPPPQDGSCVPRACWDSRAGLLEPPGQGVPSGLRAHGSHSRRGAGTSVGLCPNLTQAPPFQDPALSPRLPRRGRDPARPGSVPAEGRAGGLGPLPPTSCWAFKLMRSVFFHVSGDTRAERGSGGGITACPGGAGGGALASTASSGPRA